MQWPESLGPNLYPPRPGPLWSELLTELKDDCPACPLWPDAADGRFEEAAAAIPAERRALVAFLNFTLLLGLTAYPPPLFDLVQLQRIGASVRPVGCCLVQLDPTPGPLLSRLCPLQLVLSPRPLTPLTLSCDVGRFLYLPSWVVTGFWPRGRYGHWNPALLPGSNPVPQQLIGHAHYIPVGEPGSDGDRCNNRLLVVGRNANNVHSILPTKCTRRHRVTLTLSPVLWT